MCFCWFIIALTNTFVQIQFKLITVVTVETHAYTNDMVKKQYMDYFIVYHNFPPKFDYLNYAKWV